MEYSSGVMREARRPFHRRAVLSVAAVSILGLTACLVAVSFHAGAAIQTEEASSDFMQPLEHSPVLTSVADPQPTPVDPDSLFKPTYEGYTEFTKCSTDVFVDGQNYYKALAHAIANAKKEILLTGWNTNPETVLVNKDTSDAETLLSLFSQAVRRGVKVYVLFWKSPKILGKDIFIKRVAEGTKKLETVGVYVLKDSGKSYSLLWEQHQKTVSVDRTLSFVGGLDVCMGRYDTNQHVLNDILRRDQDTSDWSKIKDYQPWHDIQAQVDGDTSAAVARNFAQRWKTVCDHEFFLTKQKGCKVPLPNQDATVTYQGAASTIENTQCQVTRSIGEWSSPGRPLEVSAYDSYMDIIRQSKRFVYIENQYFGSAPYSQNEVSYALVDRIVRALKERAPFSVAVVIPSATTFKPYIYMIQKTIYLGEKAMWSRLTSALEDMKSAARADGNEEAAAFYDKVDLKQYLSFYYLANQKVTTKDGVTSASRQQIYVHSKIVVIDDTVAIVGSANICDRSFKGTRDSELGLVLRPTATFPCKLGGEDAACGEFAAHLRKKLFGEHLNIDLEDPRLADFASAYETLFRPIASRNALAHKNVFGYDPEKFILKDDYKKVYGGTGFKVNNMSAEQTAELGTVQGLVFDYPVNFWGDDESKVISIENKIPYMWQGFT